MSSIERWLENVANEASDSSSDPIVPRPFLEIAPSYILSSRTSHRLSFLQGPLLYWANNEAATIASEADVLYLTKLLLCTIPLYIDSASRAAVLDIVTILVKKLESVLQYVASDIAKQSSNLKGRSLSSQLTLLTWSAKLYALTVQNDQQNQHHLSLLKSWALLYDSFHADKLHAYKSLRRAAKANSLSVMRSKGFSIQDLIQSLTSANLISQLSWKASCLLGLIIQFKNELGLENKDKLLSFFFENLLNSKDPVPQRATEALGPFFSILIKQDPSSISSKLVSEFEKSISRFPQPSLSTLKAFCNSCNNCNNNNDDDVIVPIDTCLFLTTNILNALLSQSRSVNLETRAETVSIFSALVSNPGHTNTEDNKSLSKALEQITTPLRQGKTASPEHRTTLVQMLKNTPPSQHSSQAIVPTILTVLGKEMNEAAYTAIFEALNVHLPCLLQNNIPIASAQMASLTKTMVDVKPVMRKAACSTVGNVARQLHNSNDDLPQTQSNDAIKAFFEALLPSLDTNLKNASNNVVNTPAGPLEGYVASFIVCSLLPVFEVSCSGKLKQGESVIKSIDSLNPKPSFLITSKVYHKFDSVDDQIWFARSLFTVVEQNLSSIIKDEAKRLAFASAVIHATVESPRESRQVALEQLTKLNKKSPVELHSLLLDSLQGYIQNDANFTSPTSSSKLQGVFLSLAKFQDTSSDDREKLLNTLLIPTHHPLLNHSGTSLWISLLQQAQLDPFNTVANSQTILLQSIWDNARNKLSGKLSQAPYKALSSLILIAPDLTIPATLATIREHLVDTDFTQISQTDCDIYNTPPDVMHTNVLEKSANSNAQNVKKKGADLDKWDAEVRESLAKKKGNQPKTLSKADQALVDAQLKKEAEIRSNVASSLDALIRGLEFAKCLVQSPANESCYAEIIQTSLIIANLSITSLSSETLYGLLLTIVSQCASFNIQDYREVLLVAVLRIVNSPLTPQGYKQEPLDDLITRVLYRLRFKSEQAPFDAPTFTLFAPILSNVISNAVSQLSSDADNEKTLEQLTLVMNIISYHTRQSSIAEFPRVSVIDDLLQVLNNIPTHNKPAAIALADIGKYSVDTISSTEIETLLTGIVCDDSHTRHACLQALEPLDLTDTSFPCPLYLACYEDDARNQALALDIWQENALDVPSSFFDSLSPYFGHKSEYARTLSPLAILSALNQYPDQADSVLDSLIELYREDSKELEPEYDAYGMVKESSLNREDPWKRRVAEALTLKIIAPMMDANICVPKVFNLLIDESALGDRNSDVRASFLQVGIAYIESHGDKQLDMLNEKFEKRLAKPSTGEFDDRIFEAVVILFGRLARHLQISDPRTAEIMKRLLDALKTPSELVQMAVSECLGPLVPRKDPKNAELVENLLTLLFSGPSFGERRGAAYGLLGVVRGHGINALKDFAIIDRIIEASEDKKHPEARQGALFAIEIFYSGLGRIFEPFVIQLLPNLLSSLGDSVTDVRNAAQTTSRVMMRRLSSHAVKLILPSLLDGLDENQWRSKKGAVEMLGSMAFLAPRQLSYSLPQIIPRLTEVLADTHFQVRGAANSSLKQFGDVINNPEIRNMQSTLLAALVDPSQKTLSALDSLLATVFVHYLDSSSLALVVPIVERGLRERTSEFKRKASQIVGNMASITSGQDFQSYLPQLLPHVREVLVDPVPEARATAARSLGALVERLGEEVFPDLIPSLIARLESDNSGVDQQGSAQGLAEILAAIGVERLESFLPTVIKNTSSTKSYIREGFISLLIYLPTTFGERFTPYLPQIIQPVLSGLADGSDFVRDASMRAGRMIIATHSTRAVDLLLPELEKGLFDDAWRIRQSSIQLVGELLFKVSGVTGKVEVEETEDAEVEEEVEDTQTSATSRKALVDALGVERRDQVLARIFIARQDSSTAVRNHATHVWKVLVQNTPRTARDLTPTLMDILVQLLSSDDEEQRDAAARTLGELCRKLGERVLDRIFQVLSTCMDGGVRVRQGACFAICEILASTSKTQLELRQAEIVKLVQKLLVDEDATVRTAAAQAFDSCQQFIGAETLGDTIPGLLEELEKGGAGAESASGALREIMQVRAQDVFPTLIPSLIAQPISQSHANALALLLPVSKGAISQFSTQILNALRSSQESEKDESCLEAISRALTALLSSITASDGLHYFMLHLLSKAKENDPDTRKAGCELFTSFCQVTSEDLSSFYIDWIRQLVSLFEDPVEDVINAAWKATEALSKKFSKSDMEQVSVPLRRTIENVGSPGRDVPGFSRPNGIKPILPILLQGFLGGTAEQREQSALGIADLVNKTSQDVLKPSIPTIAGPLIRVLGERLPPPVKGALLFALTTLLQRVPQFLKPFFPQLQRTFIKNISDSSSLLVRNRAVDGLSVLMSSQTRVDPVVTELMTSSNSEVTNEVRDSLIRALGGVIVNGGKHITHPTKTAIVDYLSEWLAEAGSQESLNGSLAEVFASLAMYDNTEHFVTFLNTQVIGGKVEKPLFSVMALKESLEKCPSLFETTGTLAQAEKQVNLHLQNEDNTVVRIARQSKELIKGLISS